MRRKEEQPSAPPKETDVYNSFPSRPMQMYPDLTEMQANEQAAQNAQTNHPPSNKRPDLLFRLKNVQDIRDFLQKESEERGRWRRRYKSLYNTAHYVNITSGCIAVGSSTAATISLSTVVGAIASLPLGIVAISTGVIGVVSSKVSKVFLKKVEKHAEIKSIALSKLSSVNDLVSKALMNTEISDEEHECIIREMESYNTLKSQIRRKIRNDLSTEREEEIKKEAEKKGVLRGQQMAFANLQNTMKSSMVPP